MASRYLAQPILDDLKEKMVFLGGPRQVGKTTLALTVARENFRSHDYLNWDDRDDKRRFREARFRADAEILLFDEVHKYRPWKSVLKGIYDKNRDRFRILVTGSARLDIYRKGGDSLMGRYHYHRLHPFSVAEALGRRGILEPLREIDPPAAGADAGEALDSLLSFGGFPEPFFRQSGRALRRWHGQRVERLVKEDIRDLEGVRDLSAIEVLADMLPARVGSLFSLNAVREDLSVAHKTVSLWVDILERFYYLFRIYPFAHERVRSLKKSPKLYLWDWSEVPEEGGARLENLVASHLLKICHHLVDADGYKADLCYLRDLQGREVDFLATVGGKPWFAVEVKKSGRDGVKNLKYFADRLKIPYLYRIVLDRGIHDLRDGVRTVSADRFLAALI
jgi:uncharacterized protein